MSCVYVDWLFAGSILPAAWHIPIAVYTRTGKYLLMVNSWLARNM